MVTLKGILTLIAPPSNFRELARTGSLIRDWGGDGRGGVVSVYKAAGEIVFRDDDVDHTKPCQK